MLTFPAVVVIVECPCALPMSTAPVVDAAVRFSQYESRNTSPLWWMMA